jgi:hypothetical protein
MIHCKNLLWDITKVFASLKKLHLSWSTLSYVSSLSLSLSLSPSLPLSLSLSPFQGSQKTRKKSKYVSLECSAPHSPSIFQWLYCNLIPLYKIFNNVNLIMIFLIFFLYWLFMEVVFSMYSQYSCKMCPENFQEF